MKPKIVLRPGVPNDENRDYLPEAIKGSQMVVNENGNNSQPYPPKLQEFTGDIVGDGLCDVWYEYVPDSYDPEKKTPLVFSMHGGLMTGWGQCIYTSWTYIAEREGFICVFPSAHARRFWQIMCEDELKEELSADDPAGIFLNDFPADIRENHDANLVLALLERMKCRYNIDDGRVYMQGMSLGNAMTHMMSKFYAHKFAAMAGSAGPARKTLLYRKDGTPDHRSLPVDAWQTRMELDGPPPACHDDIEDVVAYNRQYWMQINQCDPIPKIRLFGENNLAFFTGKAANYIFRDVKNRDHGQTFDDAELVWDYLFSGARRAADGTIVHVETALPQENDAVSLAAVAGCGRAWLNGQIVDMPGEACGITPTDSMWGNWWVFIGLLILAFFVVCLTFSGIYFYAKRILLYPLNKIREVSQQIAEGASTIQKAPENIQEIADIQDALEVLVEQKVVLETEKMRQETQKEHAMLQYYQLQTRSHFLLNCLKSLYHLTMKGDQEKTLRIITRFSNHIRYMFHDSLTFVPIRAELSEVDDYFEIIALERTDPILLTKSVDPQLMEYPVPPLLIQTFVENFQKHNPQSDKVLNFSIRIDSLELGGQKYVRIRLSDNGIGYSEEALQQLQLMDGVFAQFHVGIQNLCRRIEILYKKQHKTAFYNLPNGGACSVFYLPASFLQYHSDTASEPGARPNDPAKEGVK